MTLMFSFTASPLLAAPEAASIKLAQDDYGLDAAADAAGVPKTTNFPQTIGMVLFTVISLIGVFFLVLMVYGGFLWMTAGGSSEKTKKAGAIMRNGAIGVVIVLSAYAITRFVIIDILVGTDNANTNTSSSIYAPTLVQQNQLSVNPETGILFNL